MRTKSVIAALLFSTALVAQTPAQELFNSAMYGQVPPERFVWNWRDAVLLKSFTDIWRDVPSRRAEVERYTKAAMERLAPKAHGKNPNAIASGCGLAFLIETGTASDEVKAAAARVHRQYLEIMRTSDGACSHRAETMELWDDTLYMLDIFLIGMYRAEGNPACLDELVREILTHAKRLRDGRTGLWWHGWAESSFPSDDGVSQYGWNSNPAHRSNEFWGRGNGWIAMTLADVLEVLPEEHPARAELEGMFARMMRTLLKLQDRKTGMWFQLPAVPKAKGNYTESSATAMFAFAMAKGYGCGLLPKKYGKAARKAFDGLCRYGLEGVGTSDVRLGKVCEGTCIGDREYYLGRKTSNTETYAAGAFLMLANQLKQIQ